ncbi:MAG: superoxide dismutase [Ni], partial [Pseudomonadota bacterium]
HPNVHGLVHAIMQKASACKQDVHREDGLALVELVNEFAEIFWKTKSIGTVRKTCPYPPQLKLVYPVLAD